jgi:hypothetical protein
MKTRKLSCFETLRDIGGAFEHRLLVALNGPNHTELVTAEFLFGLAFEEVSHVEKEVRL